MADEMIEKVFRPEIVAKASPDSKDPMPKTLANEEDWASIVERNTIARLEETATEEQQSGPIS
jgi:hypothetical protein